MNFTTILTLVCVVSVAAPESLRPQADTYDSGGPLIPEQAAYDVGFYDLRLIVDPDDRSIAGSIDVFAEIVSATDVFVLDLDSRFDVSSVAMTTDAAAHPSLDFERRGGKLWIRLPSQLVVDSHVGINVSYHGKPRAAPNAPWSGGFSWSETPAGLPWIATSCQQEGPDIWWPSKDHPSDKPDSMALHITAPRPLVVATNGRLLDTESHPNGTQTYHWFVSTPINSYNIALNIGPYRTIEESFTSITGESFPVVFWVLPENYASGQRLMPEILQHLRFFEELVGPYPFRADKYGVVETPHLGMEHQTIIAYGGRFQNGAMTGGVDWGFDALHHHELSHEWFGNLMTNADWKDMWLHEGFGSYAQPVYLERTQGFESARAYLATLRDNIGNRSAVAPRASQTAKQIYGGDIYFKGAWILHTLRYLMGDDAFFRAYRRLAYPEPALEQITDGSHAHFATTDDFLEIAEQEADVDLDWFFEVYLRQPRLPRLRTSMNGDQLELRWDVPRGLEFRLPVEVLVDGAISVVEMTDGRGSLTAGRNARITIDPNSWILMEGGRN